MFTLRDFLASREVEIREQIKLLRAELAELKRAKAAVEQPDGTAEDAGDSEVRESGRTTIKDMVRSVFARQEAAGGMAAGEVLEAIERSFNVRLERTSLSPQLSRLRESGDVVLQDGRWFPSEPRLAQAVAVTAAHPPKVMHYGGGEVVTAAKAFDEVARLSRATMGTQSAVEEAMNAARAAVSRQEPISAVKLATNGLSSLAIEAAQISAATCSAARPSMPHTMKSMEEADRKMQGLASGSYLRGAQKNWGSGPKTE